jgi:hypothetical protein
VLKSISIKSVGGISKVLRYVFDKDKQNPKAQRTVPNLLSREFNPNSFYYTALRVGVLLTAQDLKHIHSEIADARISSLYERYSKSNDKSFGEFVQANLISKEFMIRHNVRGADIPSIADEYQQLYEGRARKSSKDAVLSHFILSFKGNSEIPSEPIVNMCRSFFQLRGAQYSYVASIHRNTESAHCHIIMNNTDMQGKSARISKRELQTLKLALEREMEKYPELSQSKCNHSLESGNSKKIAARLYQKPLIEKSIETHFPKATSTKHFLELLQADGYTPYVRNNKVVGITNEAGMKFRFSRFDINLEVLRQKDVAQEKEEKLLKEFAALRAGRQHSRAKEQPQEVEQREHLSEQEQHEFDAMQSIRTEDTQQQTERTSKQEDTTERAAQQDEEKDTEQQSSRTRDDDKDNELEQLR